MSTPQEVARDLRAASTSLRRYVDAAMADSGSELVQAVRRGADRIPAKGGLRARVKGSWIRARRQGGGSRWVVSATPREPVDLQKLDAGTVWHPTYGHRPYKGQRVPPGWWTEPLWAGTDRIVRPRLERATDQVVRRLNRG